MSLVYPPESDGSPLSPWESWQLELNCFEYYKQLFGMILSDLHLIKTLISSGQSSFSLLKHKKIRQHVFHMAWLLGNMMMNHWIWDDLRKPSDVPPPLLLCDWRPPFGALRLDLRGASDVPLPGPSTWTEAPGHGTIHGTGRSMGPIGPTDFSKKCVVCLKNCWYWSSLTNC